MSFWKADVKPSDSSSKTLTSVTLQKSGDRFVGRFNMADGSFFDVDAVRLPRFDLGETCTFSVWQDLVVPTKEVK